jgi:hypothetical protein
MTRGWVAERLIGDTDRVGTGGRGRRSGRPMGSALVHGISRVASHPLLAVVVVAADLVWVLYSTVAWFPGRVETIFRRWSVR